MDTLHFRCTLATAEVGRIAVLLVALGILGTETVCAGTNVWTSIGPDGGLAGTLAIDPQDPATIYAGTAAGTLFSIFGATNSVGAEQKAGSGNLPTTLGGVMVSINGKAVPLLYVGPNQINGQVPYETAAGGGSAQVIANGISAAQVPFALNPAAPRIFSGQGNVCIARNEDGTLNSAVNPVKTGHHIVAYLIGLGAVNPAVATGAPAPTSPPSSPPGLVSASLGGRSVSPAYLGLMPGYVGFGEVNLLVPSDVTSGLLNFVVTVGNVTSNMCLIAVGN